MCGWVGNNESNWNGLIVTVPPGSCTNFKNGIEGFLGFLV